MLFYSGDENSTRFPQHNGYRGWRYYAKTVEDAALEDLFWRKLQTSPSFAREMVRAVWPDADCRKRDIFIRPNFYVSLMPESCGAYTFGAWSGLCALRGDASDTKRIEQEALRPDWGSYYPGSLIAKHKGWLPQNVVPNLLQAMGQKLTISDRFRFNLKAKHRQVLMGKALADKEVEAIVKMAYPVIYGLTSWKVYWYRAENGNVSHGVVYFNDSSGHVHKLTISAWQPEFPSVEKIIFDMLNIGEPYPLYALDEIVRHASKPYALVCGCEAIVEYIKREHAWPHNWGPVTSYAAIDSSDWSKLRGKTPIIFPEATEKGCREAFRLHTALVKDGFKPLFLARTRGNLPRFQEFAQDIGRLAFKNGECSLSEFAEHCQREFGVLPPDGVLPKAVALADLPEPAVAPEVLMEGLLDTGEQMMLHAWRGVGKSLFVLLWALCFASGKSALNGRVCPSRKYRVLLLDGEMSAYSLKKRARRLCAGHGLPTEAIADVKVRSIIVENKDLTLETEEGLKGCMSDLMWADIIIVDSVFKFFPTAMAPEFAGAGKMLDFLKLCRLTGKTLILIDHEGKSRATSFGTMGKEIALDVVLRLCKTRDGHGIQALVQKARDHAEPLEAYLEMRIEVSEKDDKIAFQVREELKIEGALGCKVTGLEDEAEFTESSAERALSLNEAIIRYVSEHPDVAQGKMAEAIIEMGYGKHSAVHARIKLSEGGKLPDWHNRPETHKVAEQPASEGDED